MSDHAGAARLGWVISVRKDGDVLAARARGEEIELMLLSRSAGYDPAQIESWLAELIGVAVETSRNDSGDRPISSLLRQGLSGLLFSHAELWHHTPQDPPCSIAFIHTHSRVSFGWAGPAEVEVWVDGQPAEGPWIRVRDPDGRAAQALEVEAWRRMRLRLAWTASGGAGAKSTVVINAEWPGSAMLRPEPARAADSSSQWRAPSWLRTEVESIAPAGSEPSAKAPPPARVVPASPPPVAAPDPAWPGAQRVEIRLEPPVAPVARDPAPVAPAAREAPPAAPAEPTPLEIVPIGDADQPHGASEQRPVRPIDIERSVAPGSTPARATTEPLEIVRSLDPDSPDVRETLGPGARTAPARPAEPLSAAQRPPQSAPMDAVRRVRRPDWPAPPEAEPRAPWWMGIRGVAAAVVALFLVGWILGGLPGGRHDERGGIQRPLSAIGLGPARSQLSVDSHPQGAWIALDGRDLARRTPSTIEVAPGRHEITLSVANLGSASTVVEVKRNERNSVDALLWGALSVRRVDSSIPVKVSVDDVPRGLAPLVVDQLAPGVHHVQFWSPGTGAWDQIVEIRVRDTAEVVARPFASPATGQLEVRATLTEDGQPVPVSGATVWLDGEIRGVTPLPLELPRGPHSVRVSYNGQDSPVQVIDLPGGNQRFATFDLSFDPERPRLVVPAPGRLSRDRPTLVSATLENVYPGDVREMWLHVSSPEASWRRYPMNVLKSPSGSVGAVVFPLSELDPRGRARYFVSATTRGGDEIFSEIASIQGPPANAASSK